MASSYCNLCNGQCNTIGHAAARPVETRPPAPTLDTCPFYTNGQHSWGLGSRCTCGQFRAHPEPIEQAAPPRPRRIVTAKECVCIIVEDGDGNYCDRNNCSCPYCWCNYGLCGFGLPPRETFIDAAEANANPEREPQRSEVKPNEAQSQKSAAIEQARPQTPERFTKIPLMPVGCLPTCGITYSYYHAQDCNAAAAEPAPERTPPQLVNSELVTHEQASDAALTLIDAAFRNGKRKPKFHIPVEQNDTDVLLMRYIRQQKSAVPEPAAQQESPWMLMTCAPKDGTHILASEGATGRGFGVCGGRTQPFAAVVHWWDGEDEGWYLSSGSCDQPLTGLVRWQYFDRAAPERGDSK